MELKIHLYTICWNEAKILPHFLRYYDRFCEKMFIYDNFSSDNSIEIIKQFSKAEALQYYTNDQIKDDIYLKIKNEVWKKSRGKCDYVIICDVDEFIYHENLLDFFMQLKQRNISVARCEGYNMISEQYPGGEDDVLKTIQYGVRSVSFDKVLLFNPDLIEEINFEYGAHDCSPIGIINFSNYELKLLHYKYLSLEYLQMRYKQMGDRLSKNNKKFKLGTHYLFSATKIKREFRSLWNKREKVI